MQLARQHKYQDRQRVSFVDNCNRAVYSWRYTFRVLFPVSIGNFVTIRNVQNKAVYGEEVFPPK